MIKVGCCGWAEAQERYRRDFSVVEVQGTFYQPGSLETYEKWRADAGRDFEFTVTAWQLITHEPSSPTYRKLKHPVPSGRRDRYGSFRPSDEVRAAWEVTDSIAQALDARVILFQCPAAFSPTGEHTRDLRAFFRRIDRRNYTLAWEPRGSWEEKDIRRLCRDLDLVHCVDPFTTSPLHGGIRYFRLHGRPGYTLRYRYTDDDLAALLRLIDRGTAYVLFNNVSMLSDAGRFQRLLARP